MSTTPNEREAAPPHSLPNWSECAMRVDNSNFFEKSVAEGGYGPEWDSKLASELHRFIYEYDDADPYRSAWFLHRLELVLKEQIALAAAGAKPEPEGEATEFEKTFPDHIWLDAGVAMEFTEPGDTFRDLDDVTWSEDNATGYGVKYIRADLASIPAPDSGRAEAQPAEQVVEPTDEAILHRWDTHVGDPTPERPLTDADKLDFARAVLALASSVSKPEASLLSHAELLRELCACSAADPGRGRSNEGRWMAVNVPRELWDRVNTAAGAAEGAVQQASGQAEVPMGTYVPLETLRRWAALQESDGSPWAEGYDAARRYAAMHLGAVAKVIPEMVNRFLSWKLPATVHPDCGRPARPTDIGTNLLTADEAKQMLEHVLATPTAPTPAEAPAGQGDVFGDEEHVLVPRGLLGAACSTIDKKRDGTKTLAELRRYTVGDLSTATPLPAQVQPDEQVGPTDWSFAGWFINTGSEDEPRWEQTTQEHANDPDVVSLGFFATPAPQQPVSAEAINAAAKVLAECMDYPWEHMPAQGREQMRKHAKTVIDAALSTQHAEQGKDGAS